MNRVGFGEILFRILRGMFENTEEWEKCYGPKIKYPAGLFLFISGHLQKSDYYKISLNYTYTTNTFMCDYVQMK